MPVIYRRVHGSDVWHFRADCTQWPVAAFEQVTRTPAEGSCCMECTYWPASRHRQRFSGQPSR
jgi:hypothetical protein